MLKLKNNLKGILFLVVFTFIAFMNFGLGISNDYITFVVFISYLLTIFFLEKRFILIYGYIIFYIITNILGVFLIETGSFFLSELNIFTHRNNSLILIVIVHFLFIETLRILHNSSNELNFNEMKLNISFGNFSISKIKLLKYILILTFIIFIIMFLKVINNPFFKVKLDRFLYEEMYLSSISSKISNLALYLSCYIGMYFFYTKKKESLVVTALIFIYLFWIGHKFSLFFMIAFIIAIPFIRFYSFKGLNKILKKGLILFALLLVVVSIQSFVVYNRDYNQNTEYLKARIAQQGQLWWATYDVKKTHKASIEDLKDEFKTYFRLKIYDEDLYNSGIYKVMQITTPPDIFLRKVYEKESRYAYSTQASIYYYSNPFGLVVFSILSACLYYFINKNMIKNIVNLNIIPAFLYTRLFVIYNRTLLQSDFNKLFSIEVIIIICGLIFLSLIEKISIKIINPFKSKNRLL